MQHFSSEQKHAGRTSIEFMFVTLKQSHILYASIKLKLFSKELYIYALAGVYLLNFQQY